MAKHPSYGPGTGPSASVNDAFASFLDGVARFLFWAGLLISVIVIGLLVFTYSSASSLFGVAAEQAIANIEIYNKVLIGGLLSVFVGSTYMFWGEDIMVALQVIGAVLLFFGTPFLPSVMPVAPNATTEAALTAIRNGGALFGICAIGTLVADLIVRARDRVKQGARADALKYGKGMKEERDIQNVFMGNCWQLPFCRKFVRERCPIYHARRTCWKEQVGCMCEEEVIRGAMEGRSIPKDSIAAATYIPKNNKLTPTQKFERCKQCVIYNEHQKHKYKLALPVMVAVFVLGYVLLRPALLMGATAVIRGLDRMVGRVTFGASGNVGDQITQGAIPVHEIVLICLMVVVFTYGIKMLEYFIFKLKY